MGEESFSFVCVRAQEVPWAAMPVSINANYADECTRLLQWGFVHFLCVEIVLSSIVCSGVGFAGKAEVRIQFSTFASTDGPPIPEDSIDP